MFYVNQPPIDGLSTISLLPSLCTMQGQMSQVENFGLLRKLMANWPCTVCIVYQYFENEKLSLQSIHF